MIIFAHGLEGSPNGSKIRALRGAGFDVIAPDFKEWLAERVDLLQQVCQEHREQNQCLLVQVMVVNCIDCCYANA